MEQRTDTSSSGRFGGQWSFLSNPPPTLNHGQARSLPPSSSYIRSDRSSVSPLPTGLHLNHLNASRSSLPRNIYTPSLGGHSSATIPSQPVLIRINSADASNHLHPAPRPPRRRPIMSKHNSLPPIQEYSFEGIMNTISEDVADDITGIAEIMGRSRLVLADQHDSHLPPTGEIRATPLQAVAEASSSNERLAADNVLILNDEASLVDGSHSGSAAYGLLERLQALPRSGRISGTLTTAARPHTASSARTHSSPAVMTETIAQEDAAPDVLDARRASRDLMRIAVDSDATRASAMAAPAVAEVYLSAGADGRVSELPMVSEGGRHYPLYSYDETDVFDGNRSSSHGYLSFRERVRRLLLFRDFRIGGVPSHSLETSTGGAEARLRSILQRGSIPIADEDDDLPADREQDMYG